MGKTYLPTEEAVEDGFFHTTRQAAELRYQRKGPPFYKPNNGRVLYKRSELEAWVQKSRVLTSDTLPLHQRTGDGRP